MVFDWLRELRVGLTANWPTTRGRVRRGAKPSGFHATEALESRVMLAAAIGEVTSFSKISDTAGNFTAVLDDLDRFGNAVADLGDLDGDGIADMAVGARRDEDGGSQRGAVYVLFLNADGTVKSHQKISDTFGNFTATLDHGDYFGDSLTNLGDLDGDGITDLAVGARLDDDGGSRHGALYVLFLNTDGTVKSHQKISDTFGNFTAIFDDSDRFGRSVTNLGDLDGDGVTDMAVGAITDDDGGSDRGAVYVLFLNVDGTVKSHQKISDTEGNFFATLDDLDRFGYSLTSVGDLDGDGFDDLAVGAFADDDGGTDRGAVYILLLNPDGTVKSHTKISDTQGNFSVTLDDSDRFGVSLTSLGDLDGDGVVDLAVGTEYDDDGGNDRGAVYMLFLNANGTVKSHQKISNTQSNFTATLDHTDAFGGSLTNLGDLDGDGITELVVGTRGDDDGGDGRGAVYILSLEAVTPPGVVASFSKISDTLGNFVGVLDDRDSFGWSATDLGDLDGDGIADLAVGAIGDDDGGYNRGAVYVLFMNATGSVKSHQKISNTDGNFTAVLENSDYFGWSLANLGDLDGDGITDLAVGTYFDNDGGIRRGAVYLLFLNANGTVKSHQKISDTAGNFTASLDDGDWFGSSLADLGDLDGDGVIDLAVGAFGDDDGGYDRGAVYVLFLNTDGTVKSHQKISATAGNFTGILGDNDDFGSSLTILGDLNGDGIGDLAVGVRRDDDGGSDRGAVYVLFLDSDGTVKSHQKISDTQGNLTATLDDYDWFGLSLTSMGDLDGDGVADLVVGASGDDDGVGAKLGAVYVLFLKADGTVKAHQKISDTTGNFTGILDFGDLFGWSMSNMGDLDGDGIAELAVGAVGNNDDTQHVRGAVYILSLTGVPSVQIVDDGDAGFLTVGSWTAVSNAGAREGDLRHSAQGIGDDVARWTFTGLAPGNYRVSATWVPHVNRATNSPFTAFDGNSNVLGSVLVNQELAPDDFSANASLWEDLFVVSVTDGTLSVELSDAANGYVIADAIRIEPAPVAPVVSIIDDGEAGFVTTGNWVQPAAAVGHEGDLKHSAAGVGNDKATWTFTGLTPGHYFVAATWLEHVNRATDAPFRILDGTGGTELAAVRINQELAPNDFTDAGSDWEQLAHVTITGTELVIELTDDANQYVIADAIRIERTDTPPPPLVIIDNGDAGFSTTAGWNPAATSIGHEGDLLHTAPGTGSRIATWTFTDLTPGMYRVSATWFAYTNRATNAPFTIRDGIAGPVLDTVLVNQQLAPNDFTDAGSDWEDLTTITITGNTLVVQLTNNANGYVIADALRIESISPI